MRYIQSPPNHRGPRILLAVALSVGVHVAAVGLAGVLSGATPATLEVELPTGSGGFEPKDFEPPTGDLPAPEVPLPDVSVVEVPPPVVEVTAVEEPPPLTAAPNDFFEPTPTPAARRGTTATTTQPSATRTAGPAARANAAPGGNPGAGSPGAGASGGSRWVTPKPPYPQISRAMRQTGSGSVRVQTDAAGRVVSAEMVQSITPPLDAATTSFARGHWSGPPNRTVVIPVTFQMQ